ncbi:MAG: Gldg family protein [Hyphomonadaceae bacterium]|nr:Gldg family protein [Hyphomonadaceae bacterium]
MSPRRYAILVALALLLCFVAANVVATSWMRGWRLDLTENQLYSLSPGTKQTLDGLSEPLELTLYYARDAAQPVPQLQAYAARVREMLQAFEARSRGRIRVREVNVEAFSEEEDAAVEAGIEPVRPFQGADAIYFGLAGANAIDDRRVISFLNPQREPFLEYEITRLVFELENPERTQVALITSLPIDPAMSAFGGGAYAAFAAELGRLMEVTKLAPDFTEIPNADVLAIIHPGPLTQQQLYAIDQYVLRNGHAFIVLDPAASTPQQAGSFDPFGAASMAPTSSTLEPLLSQWGVAMTPSVVLDAENALEVGAQDPTGQPVRMRQPLFFAVPADQLNRDDLMTAQLPRGLYFGLAGGLSVSERDDVETVALARTSGQTMRMPAAQALAQPSPYDVQQMWPATGGRVETIALRLSGPLQTAFPDGAPPPDPAPAPDVQAVEPQQPTSPAAAPQPREHLARSQRPAQLVIVSDSDFLADDFYIDPNAGGAAADNGAFALNAIDVLSGSDALVSLRSRAPSARSMELLEDMERDADRRIQRRQEELQQELRETEARLAELQAGGRGSGFFAGDLGAELTSEESAEIERFRQRVVDVRSELRASERELRGDIDRLQAIVVFVNVWLAPLLVAAAGLFLFWRRQRRGRARA